MALAAAVSARVPGIVHSPDRCPDLQGWRPGDITNQQDWHACESVQRGLSSPHAAAGPLSAQEDAVYQFVTMIARGYQGQPVWNSGSPVTAG
jgi:hypothetical protein